MDVNNRKSEPIIHIMQYFSIHHIGYPCSISHTWLYPVFNYSTKKRDAWSKRKYNTSKYRIISYHSRGWIMLGRICIWLCGGGEEYIEAYRTADILFDIRAECSSVYCKNLSRVPFLKLPKCEPQNHHVIWTKWPKMGPKMILFEPNARNGLHLWSRNALRWPQLTSK